MSHDRTQPWRTIARRFGRIAHRPVALNDRRPPLPGCLTHREVRQQLGIPPEWVSEIRGSTLIVTVPSGGWLH